MAGIDRNGERVATPAGTIDPALEYVYWAETHHTLDLLLSDPAKPDQKMVVTVGRS